MLVKSEALYNFNHMSIWLWVFIIWWFSHVLFSRYASRNLSAPIKVSLQYSFSRSGIFKLDRADAVIEISEWIEVPQKNLTVANSSSVSPNISVEVGPQNTTEGSTDSLETNGGLSSTSNSSLNGQSTADLGTEKKLKKKTFRVPLKV